MLSSTPRGVSIHRRSFLQSTSMAAGCIAMTTIGRPIAAEVSAAEIQSNEEAKICVFTKPLQELDFHQLAEVLSRWPVAGVEATLRKGGQIEPEKVATELPRLQEALMARDRHYMILATDINHVENKEAELVLKTASKLGIRYFRMAYYRYALDKPILPQLELHAKQAKRLAQLCESLKLTALYQNHAGSDYVGAAVWDLVQILKDIPKEQMAIALDIRHTTVEATQAWPQSYALARPHLGAIFVKDAIIEKGIAKDVPLGEGNNASKLFQRILRDGLPGPLSLHMEHMDHTKPELLDRRIEATSRDVSTLRGWLASKT